ncbi:hypothetical protein CEUSTIGMA_g9292.t1 [Chlamydomonas eustigma]|uniref:DUF7755 domain-containing protein n=1 Tax=Chlamydomonas eustigma TaxID=1157962 RepID=A0A250XFK7_9CHLO|nr:hypothetical protein CEUSTIGMA_g9292.t1 [Chlamydomonas eustigma]|eukprot:GAX81864.1 hypothetical protein CEUSTIGMA_g9292.t1 [Chlamydomonas eustigma]
MHSTNFVLYRDILRTFDTTKLTTSSARVAARKSVFIIYKHVQNHGCSLRTQFAKDLFSVIPRELHNCSSSHESGRREQQPLTTYSLRIHTSSARGAALSDKYSAINILLVGVSGRSGVLHRLSTVADYVLVAASYGSTAATSGRLRFQEASVDEISFSAPDVGPLAGVLVGIETGTWVPQEINVHSSCTGIIDRFMCKEKVGERAGEGAVWLTSVPEGLRVYGSGETATVVSKGQSDSIRQASMTSYELLKQRLIVTTLIITGAGGVVSGILFGGAEAALFYTSGGAISILYQWLLQQGVDAAVPTGITSDASQAQNSLTVDQPGLIPSVGDRVQRFFGQPVLRLGLLAMAASFAASNAFYTSDPDSGTGVLAETAKSSGYCIGLDCYVHTSSPEGARRLLLGLLGFMSYKVAVFVEAFRQPLGPLEVIKDGEADSMT